MNTKLFPLAAAMLLTACGFHLKGSLPYDHLPYKNWHIQGGELQVPLENALRRSDGLPVSAAQAQASVTVNSVEQQKDVLTITRAAMINEYQLALRVREAVAERPGVSALTLVVGPKVSDVDAAHLARLAPIDVPVSIIRIGGAEGRTRRDLGRGVLLDCSRLEDLPRIIVAGGLA